jgi:hypothetical protein
MTPAEGLDTPFFSCLLYLHGPMCYAFGANQRLDFKALMLIYFF